MKVNRYDLVMFLRQYADCDFCEMKKSCMRAHCLDMMVEYVANKKNILIEIGE